MGQQRAHSRRQGMVSQNRGTIAKREIRSRRGRSASRLARECGEWRRLAERRSNAVPTGFVATPRRSEGGCRPRIGSCRPAVRASNRRANPNATRPPGWLVEGIADYIRWFLYEPESRGAEITAANISKARYDMSYRGSANFLNWVAEPHDRKLVTKLERRPARGTVQG